MTPTKKQLAAQKKLTMAVKKAKIEYAKLPPNMKTRSHWHELIRKNYRVRVRQ